MVLFTYVHRFGAILRRIEAFCEGVGAEGGTEAVVFLSAFILLVVARKRDENSQRQENAVWEMVLPATRNIKGS